MGTKTHWIHNAFSSCYWQKHKNISSALADLCSDKQRCIMQSTSTGPLTAIRNAFTSCHWQKHKNISIALPDLCSDKQRCIIQSLIECC